MDLVRILPGSEVGRDVLSHPNEEGDEQKTEIKWHPAARGGDGKVNATLPEKDEDGRNQEPPDVIEPMMSKEIDIN